MRSHLRRAELDPRRLLIYGVLGVWVWAVGGAHADAYEPDDTAENATLIEANETQTGRSIDPAGDVDWIRFTVDEDSKVIVQAKVDTDTFDELRITLFDGDRDVIDYNFGSIEAFLSPGDYFATVEDDVGTAVVSSYTLVVSFLSLTPDRYEDDNGPGPAPFMTLGASQPGRTLAPLGDEDWIVFSVDENTPMAVDAVVSLGAVEITVFDDALTEIDSNSTRVFPDLAPGTYYARVTEDGDDDVTAAYTLNLWRRDGPDPYEDDDTPERATWIGNSGPKQTRNFHDAGDEDWMRFYVLEGESIACEAVGLGSEAQPHLSLFENDGVTLLREEEDFIFWTAPATGFYLVRAVNGNGAFGPETHYTIGVPLSPTGIVPGTLLGIVTASGSGDPIVGAKVEITNFGNFSGFTDEQGVYVFPSLPIGQYTLRAVADGFAPGTAETVRVGSGSTLRNLALAPARIPTDINGDNVVNAVDVQLVINAVLGLNIGSFDADVNDDNRVDAVDVQTVINAVLNQ